MKKYRIEIGLSIILFISVVVLIVNIIIKVNKQAGTKFWIPLLYNNIPNGIIRRSLVIVIIFASTTYHILTY